MHDGTEVRPSRRSTTAGAAGAILFLAALGGAEPPGPPGLPTPATREMAALLEQTAALVDPLALSLVVNDRRADLLARQLAQAATFTERVRLRLATAAELVNSGRLQAALTALQALEGDVSAHDPSGWLRYRPRVRMLEALAHMRRAEDENCHLASTRDACLVPIRGQGIHQKREGATRAVRVLDEVLRAEPGNLRARWLLNIAHMTLGSYPGGVPVRHRIPPSAFASDYPLPRFDNVAAEVGVDLYALSGGAILDDFDGDGRLDLMVSSIGFADQLRYFHNTGAGRFEDRTERAGLTGEVGGLNLIQADYDNDGFVDVARAARGLAGIPRTLSPFAPAGPGRWDVHGRDERRRPPPVRAHADRDLARLRRRRTGSICSSETSRRPATPIPARSSTTTGRDVHERGPGGRRRLRGVREGRWSAATTTTTAGPISTCPSSAATTSCSTTTGRAARARVAGWRFTNVAAGAGVTDPRDSFGAFFFDYDNDGWLDLFVAGYGKKSAEGLPVVEDVAADYLGLPTTARRGGSIATKATDLSTTSREAAGLAKVVPAMGLNFGDLDNDGWLDFYLGTGTPDLGMLIPNRMFRNADGRTFQDVTTAGNFGHLQKGHAVCFGDVDDDGDQDVFEEMGGAFLADKARSMLYANPGSANGWLSLELEGVRSNRRAMGARIKIVLDAGGAARVLYRTVGSGGSFGASPLRQEIGLGPSATVARVEITWPATGETQRLDGLTPRHRYRVREGDSRAIEVGTPAR